MGFGKEHSNIGNGYELTHLELACLQMNADGLENKAIADHLKIVEKEVGLHLQNAQQKLGAANRLQAIITALKKGLIDINGYR